MSGDLSDLEVVGADRGRNPWTTLRFQRFAVVQLETGNVEVGCAPSQFPRRAYRSFSICRAK